MILSRQQLRRFTWLALIVMLGLALAPTISRALSLRGGTTSQYSAASVAGVAPGECDEHDPASANQAAHAEHAPSLAAMHSAGHGQHGSGAAEEHDHLNHCPMCGVAATAWTVAPAPSALTLSGLGAARHVASGAEAIAPAVSVWSAHRSRGPPTLG